MTNKHQPGFTTCPHCSVNVAPQNLEKHIQRVHGESTPKQNLSPRKVKIDRRIEQRKKLLNANKTGTCPECGKVIQERYLEGHLKLHEMAKTTPIPEKPVADPPIKRSITPSITPSISDNVVMAKHRLPGWGTTGFYIGKGTHYDPPKQFSRFTHKESWYHGSSEGPVFETNSGSKVTGKPKRRIIVRKAQSTVMPPPRPAKTRVTSAPCPVCSLVIEKAELPSHILTHPEGMLCPACQRPLNRQELSVHMRRHFSWCPVCGGSFGGLANHLHRAHHLRLEVKLTEFYQPSWETKPQFICEQCNEKMSLADYPQHQHLYKPAPKSTQLNANKPAEPSKKASGNKMAPCPFCQKDIVHANLQFHVSVEHHECPYCQQRLALKEIRKHIETDHSGKLP